MLDMLCNGPQHQPSGIRATILVKFHYILIADQQEIHFRGLSSSGDMMMCLILRLVYSLAVSNIRSEMTPEDKSPAHTKLRLIIFNQSPVTGGGERVETWRYFKLRTQHNPLKVFNTTSEVNFIYESLANKTFFISTNQPQSNLRPNDFIQILIIFSLYFFLDQSVAITTIIQTTNLN